MYLILLWQIMEYLNLKVLPDFIIVILWHPSSILNEAIWQKMLPKTIDNQ